MGDTNTFIAVAPDCPATVAEVPAERRGTPTVASIQYTMPATAPGRWSEEDVLPSYSPQYERLRSDPGIRQLRAMRSRRPRG